MKPNLTRLFFLLLLGFLLTACGGEEAATPTSTPPPATSTPAPTATTPPTATPVPPTPTAAPTATPAVSANLVPYSAPEAGIDLLYPDTWFAENQFGFLIFASNEALLDAVDPGEEGGAVLVLSGGVDEFETTEPTAALEQAFDEMGLGADAEIVSGPTAVTVNGLPGATALIRATADDDTPVSVLLGVVFGQEQVAIFFGVTPQISEADFLPTFNAMFASLALSAPVVADPGDQDGLPAATGGTLAIGDTVTGVVGTDAPSVWTFEGAAGTLVTLTVTPLSDDLDAVVDLLDADGVSLLGGELDAAFDEESADNVPLPADGTYRIVVRGFADSTGEFQLALAAGDSEPLGTIVPLEQTHSGSLTTGDPVLFSFLARADDLIDINVSPTTEGTDVVVDVLDADGVSILADGPLDSSFDTEFLRLLSIPATGYYNLEVSGFDGSTGDFSFFIARPNGGGPGSILLASRSVSPGDTAAFPLTAAAGDRVVMWIRPAQRETDLVLALVDATGQLAEEDATTGFEELPLIVPSAGEYAYQVTHFEGSTGEAFDLALIGPPSIRFVVEPGDNVIGRFESGESLAYLFNGQTGQTLTVDVTSRPGTDTVVRLLDGDGQVLTEVDEGFSGDPELLTYDFTMDLPVVIEVSSFGGGSGGFNMSLR